MGCKKSLLVNVCTCSFLSCFPIVSFVSWDRRRKSCEEQQALSSFWSSEQKTVSQNLQEGKMMTWWSDVNLKNPRKNPVYVLIVLFFFFFSNPGHNWLQFEFRSLHLLLCLHPLLIDLAQLPQQLPFMYCTVAGQACKGKQGGSPKQVPQSASAH